MKSIVRSTTTLLQALSIINELSEEGGNLTLFVIDNNEKLIGTLTDGDIRRSLLSGKGLNEEVSEAVHKNCKSLLQNETSFVEKIHELRLKDVKALPILDSEGRLLDIIDFTRYKSYLPIDAVLMAGGKGERLRPLTEKTPKPLVKVGDKCIIDYNIDSLIEYGVKHLNVTVNYLGEQLEEHFAEPRNGVQVCTIREPKYLGTIGSIKFVESFHNDYILVMNSDLFTDIDFEDFFLHFREHDAEMSVAAVPYNVSIPFGILELDGRNIKGLLEKPKYNYYANAGVYLLKKSVLAEIPEDIFFNATDLIEKLIAQGKSVIRYPLKGTWIDIGQHADLAKARDLVGHMK